MRDSRSMPPCAVIPVLAYPNVARAVEWLCDRFGFAERWRAGNHRAQLSVGEGAIAITEGASGESVASVMVRVDDVDAHFARATERGVEVGGAPVDYPYGERQYTAVDLGGNHWTFSQTIADVAPEDWGGTSSRLEA